MSAFGTPEIADAADYDEQLGELTRAALDAEHVCDGDVLLDLETQLAAAKRHVEHKNAEVEER